MGDGHHRAPRHQPGEGDHPGGSRPYLRPGCGGEVHSPVSGGPRRGRWFESPEHPAGPAHRPGPRTARTGPAGLAAPASTSGTPARTWADTPTESGAPRRAARDQQHQCHQHGDHPRSTPNERGPNRSGPKRAGPTADRTGYPARAVMPRGLLRRRPGATHFRTPVDKPPSWPDPVPLAGVRMPPSGVQAPQQRRSQGPAGPPPVRLRPASAQLPPALIRPPRAPAGRGVARPAALPVHFTRDPVRRVDFARPATGGRTRPGRCPRQVRVPLGPPSPPGPRTVWVQAARHVRGVRRGCHLAATDKPSLTRPDAPRERGAPPREPAVRCATAGP